MKRNAVFQKVAPFFPQLKLGEEEKLLDTAETPTAKGGAVANPIPKPALSAVSPGAISAKFAAPRANLVAFTRPTAQPARKPVTVALPLGGKLVGASQLLVQKGQIGLPRTGKKGEEVGKRSTTPNKHS